MFNKLNFTMQRIYNLPKSKKPDTTEFFELRENTPQEHFDVNPAYKIPSSSNIINNKTYKPATQAYPPLEEKPQNKETRQQQQTSYISPRSLHCIVIADHIIDCPICSRFYRNYTPFYNIIIMILLMIMIFLFIRCQKLSMIIPKTYTS